MVPRFRLPHRIAMHVHRAGPQTVQDRLSPPVTARHRLSPVPHPLRLCAGAVSEPGPQLLILLAPVTGVNPPTSFLPQHSVPLPNITCPHITRPRYPGRSSVVLMPSIWEARGENLWRLCPMSPTSAPMDGSLPPSFHSTDGQAHPVRTLARALWW